MDQQVIFGDCREILKSQPDNYFDSLVTDPPSGIGMCGEKWDLFKPDDEEVTEGVAELLAFQNFLVEVFREVYRVLKPGAFGLVWALPRTSHHTGMALERSGFEIRDRLTHLFSQGYKKGLDIKKSLLAQGLDAEAKKWTGYHTGLKPAVEDWWLIRKPISKKIIENLLKYGTGALNIDPSRVYTDWNEPDRPESWKRSGFTSKPEADKVAAPPGQGIECHPLGRWPANLLLSHSQYDYYTLRKDVPRDTASAIHLYYRSHETLRPLQETIPGDAVFSTEKEVLQSEVLHRQSEISQEDGMGQVSLSGVQERIRGNPGLGQEWEEKVLQQEVSRPSSPAKEEDGTPCRPEYKTHVRGSEREVPSGKVLSVERGEVLRQGRVPVCNSEFFTREGSEVGGPNDSTGLHTGASSGNGYQVEQSPRETRGSSPPERNQGRQSGREFIFIKSEGSQYKASGSGEGVDSFEVGEHCFEVPIGLIPNGWLTYFEFSRTGGCQPIGSKVIKGDPRGDCKGTRPGGFYSPGSASGDGKPNAYVYGDQEVPVYECVEGCPVRTLDQQSGSGLASRFFKVFEPEYESNFIYQAKPSPTEKNADLDEGLVNEHKTVKSLKLMTYLVRLVTPEGGKTLDPFAGSGTTLVAAAELGFGFLGIERDDKTWPVLKSRIDNTLRRVGETRERDEDANLVFELESE